MIRVDEFAMSTQTRLGILTFFGLLRVTLVIPGTLVKPSLAIDLRAFFSLREWTTVVLPAGILSPVSSSESESSDPSSSAVAFFSGTSSSGSSSTRGFAILNELSLRKEISEFELCGYKNQYLGVWVAV